MATNWDQEPVYNDLLEKAYCAPNVGKEPVYKAVPAGCSVVAMAQIMASLEPNLTIDGIKIDWEALKAQPQILMPLPWKPNQGSPEIVRTMVAKLFKHIYDLSGTHQNMTKQQIG